MSIAVRRRVRARVEGTVQGVGFRPHVHRLAAELGVNGLVLNDDRGVVLEAEADGDVLTQFLERVASDAPPLAVVESVTPVDIPATGARGFVIAPSRAGAAGAPITADTATCADCLAELFDPADRRHRYPFVNCTNCGPRFTIVRGVPYDRPLTTMAAFTMCAACQAEYDDPANRRFHAEPNACPACGPQVRLEGVACADPIAEAADRLLTGAILAVKGAGGYHLACRADDEDAVARLRVRKHREDRPFAVMVGDIAAAHELAVLGPEEDRLLAGPAAPIVLAPRRPGAGVAPSVAPRVPELGLMLPYTPLHHLLLADTGVPLVMTSGNISDEPIAFEDADALERLGRIADGFLLHDRRIETRTDDSVVRARQVQRRSRGFVPAPLALPVAADRPLLAVGAEQKSTFCLATGTRAWLSHHIGDLENYETLRSFTGGIAHFQRLFGVEPQVIAHDLHPEYLSTKLASDWDEADLIGVQHHHAHLAACLAEHGETGPALGAIFDGTGYGPDGTVWGGELLLGDLVSFTRVGHLPPVAMPGGAAAVRQPWRMAASWLQEIGADVPEAWRPAAELARSGIASPLTTSMGRLFDAVAALCGLRTEVSYEGQAAIELEAACAGHADGAYPFSALDVRPALAALCADLRAGISVATIAARFHETIAQATADALLDGAQHHGVNVVVLSGGVFQNQRLVGRTRELLAGGGLRVLVPVQLPVNDGGIAFGQAAVAAARMASA